MCVVNLDECDCSCHSGRFKVSHIMPCCQRCPYCGKRLRFGFDRHVAEHKDQEWIGQDDVFGGPGLGDD